MTERDKTSFAVIAIWPMEAWLDNERAGISFIAAYDDRQTAEDLVERLNQTKETFGPRVSWRLKGQDYDRALRNFRRKENRIKTKLGLPKDWCSDMEYEVVESCLDDFRGFKIP